MKHTCKYVYSILLFVSLIIFSASAFAINGRTTYQAKIYKPDGLPLESVSVNFRFTVLDPSSSCVLYVEDYAAVNMIGSGGLTSFSLGMGTRTYPTSGPTTFANVFDNSIASFVCQTPGVYNPVPTDNRKIVMQFNEGAGWQTLPAMAINSVPYSMYSAKAQNSTLLNGKADTAFVEVATIAALNCQANEAIRFNGANFVCIAVGVGSSGISSVTTSGTVLTTGGTASAPVISISAATMSSDGYLTSLDYAEFKAKLSASSTQIVNTLGFAPVSGTAVNTQIQASQLNGDVSGTVAATVVQSVGGKTSAQVAASVDDTLAATASNTANTIVKRNSQSGVGVNYLDIYKPTTNFNIKLQAPTSLAATYTLTLPASAGTSGEVLTTDGSGNLSWISAAAAAGGVGSVSATAPLSSTGGLNPTISITQATSTTNGYLSSTDWNTFNNKQQATSAAIVATLGYTPANASSATQWITSGTDISYSAGRVGIGTSSPLAPLDVAGTMRVGNATGAVSLGSDANSYIELREPDNNGTPYFDFANDSVSDFDFRFILNGDDSFAMIGGNVGIGTHSPTGLLTLAAGTSSTAPLKLTSGTLLTTPQSGTIEYDGTNFYVTDGAGTRRALAMSAQAGSYDNVNSISSPGNLVLSSIGSVIVSNTTNSTSSQTGALIVNGGVGVAGNIVASGTITTSQNMVSPLITGGISASDSLILDSTTHATKGNISLAPSGGRVGIGTSSPANAKLHISGPANQTDILIQPTSMGFMDSAKIRFADADGGTGPADLVYSDSGIASLSVSGARFGVGVSVPIAEAEIYGNLALKGGSVVLERPITGGGWARGLSYTPDGSIDATTQGLAGIGLYGTSVTAHSIYLTHGTSPWASSVGMHILANGNVGIATTAPRQLLDVAPGTGNSVLRATSVDAAAAIQLYRKTGAAYKGHALTTTGDSLSFNYDAVENSGSTLMTLTASGNLGVGVIPTEKFDVLGNMRIGSSDSNYIAFRGTTGDGAGAYNHTYIGERVHAATESSELLLFKGNDSDNASGPDRIRMAAGNIVFDTYNTPDAPSGSFEAVATAASITTKMIIKGNGDIGMGTATPSEELTVAKSQDGDTTINVANTNAGASARTGITFTNSGTAYSTHSGGILLGGKTHGTMPDTLALFANSEIASGINIAVSGPSAPVSISTGGVERFRVAQNGYVGIGTSAPTTKLEVAGGDVNVPTGRVSFNAGTPAGTAGISHTDAGAIFGEHDLNTEVSRLVLEIFDNPDDSIVMRTNAPSGGTNVDMVKVKHNVVSLAPTTGNVGIGEAAPTSKLQVNGGIKQPNYGQLWVSWDGTTRIASMPTFLNDAYMNTHQDEVFTWRGPSPSFKDTAGCNAGPHANHMFSNSETTWGGTYRLIIGKAGATNIVEIQWAGWGAQLLDGTFSVVNTNSNQGLVNATITYSGGTWTVEHMGGQVGATPFACH